jgi:hypothetical protein
VEARIRAIDIRHAEIGQVSSRVDGSVAFRIITPELTLDQRATILGLHGINSRVMLEPIDVSIDGVDEVTTERDVKTPCQRLRGVIFVHWKNVGSREAIYSSFDEFYRSQMDRIIEGYKNKNLPD